MPIKIPAVECHENPAGGNLNGRRRIDPKTFSPAIPIEYNAAIGDLHPAIL